MKLSKTIIFFLAITLYNTSYGQEVVTPKTTSEDTLYSFNDVDELASFYGLYDFLTENIKYPAKEKKKGIEGIVYISFIVEINGSLSEIKVHKKVSPGMDNECLRVMKLISKKGKWTPAKKNGKAVRQKYILPFAFKIEQ